MGNLIIKPNTGGLLKLQDEGGTDAISISTTGDITIAEDLTVSGDLVPSTALSHRNMIINGGMQVAQRSTAEVIISDGSNEGYQTVDRFSQVFGSAAGGAVKWTQVQNEVPDISGGDMFTNSLKVQCSTATTENTNKEINIVTKLEVQDMERFGWGKTNKKDAVLSFYFKTSVTGIYSIYLQTSGSGTRRRMISFSVADTNWNRYEIPISADTVALSGASNSFGISIAWQLINVPNYEYTGGTDSGWGTTIYLTDDGQVDFMGTSNTLYLTGVQLELGSNATPFEHRSYGEELARCQRYCQARIGSEGSNGSNSQLGYGIARSTTAAFFQDRLQVKMRTAPSVTVVNPTNFYVYQTALTATTAVAFDISDVNTVSLSASVSSGLTVPTFYTLGTNNANAQIIYSSE